ncbi:mercuric reductase [Halogeometricum pallidum JCM 14848]|uniref:Mercuric reductase n=1 Tax=Halogeometricum pallidum JCM 14848 TaxID=1227487 RepID=M0DCJ1_HALPD|nr:FAD-dependent oxidoreductase [Halogeometricum pallidum]ELZ32462.1 mercuric reductase [Halogeometricum pallidum JCM 14848]
MTNLHSYDLVILGGGAAAFAAITEADRRGLSTAMVNTGLPLGGTCVNVGCVPSKHLLEVAKTAYEPPHNPFDAVEYDDDQPTTDWAAAIDEKDEIVASLREQNYVDVAEHFDTDVYEGYGRFVDDATIGVVEGADAGTTITGEKALVATGSSPDIAPIHGIDAVSYETSESILDRRDLPESVVMIGAGYVAMEWGQILHRMGADVTILQRSSHVLSSMEGLLGRELRRCFEVEGIAVETDVDVQRVSEGSETEEGVTVEAAVDGISRTFATSDLFVATGVSPNTDDIGLDEIGVETEVSGAVVVDDEFRTANPDVYAAGDCIGEPMLETVAAKEGNHAVRNAFGEKSATVDYHVVPKVVFTSPEVAAVGTTELEYMDEHGICTCRTVEMEDVPKAKAVEDTRGLVQVVKHHETDEIVGVHMVGPRAADIIPEATLAVKFGLAVDT